MNLPVRDTMSDKHMKGLLVDELVNLYGCEDLIMIGYSEILGFEHNQATAEELAKNGFGIVTADQIISEERSLEPGQALW